MIRSVRRRVGSLVIAFLPLTVGAQATATSPATQPRTTGAPRAATVDDVLAIKSVSDVAISPDGEWIAYVVGTRDLEANRNRSSIWLVRARGGAPMQLTRGERADRAPQWANDGSWLAFLSDRGEKKVAQVYGIVPGGGEAWPVTRPDSSNIRQFRLSPNGQRIAWIASGTDSKADQELERRRGRPIVRDSAYASEWAHVFVADLDHRAALKAQRSSGDRKSVV